MRKNDISSRLLGLVLSLCMVFTMMPYATMTAWADSNVNGNEIGFTCTAGGEKVTQIEKTVNGFHYEDQYGKLDSDLYTLTVPKGTTEVKFDFARECLVYEYDRKGEWVGPWYDDATKGIKAASFKITFDENGDTNCFRIQEVYNADYSGGELRAVVQFREDTKTSVKASLNSAGNAISKLLAASSGSADDTNTLGFAAMDLARAGQTVPKAYYSDLTALIIDKKGSLEKDQYSYTNNAKAVLALTAGGYDASKVAGFNMIDRLEDVEKVNAQGVNGAMYALLALDSAAYQTKDAGVRDALVKHIMDSRIESGMWNYGFGSDSDLDLTAIAVTALAPYTDKAEVKAAVDKAISWFAESMNADGTYTSYGKSNSNTTATVIWALCANGIDPENDARFARDGKNPVTGLLSFEVPTGGFGYDSNTEMNPLGTQQSYEALIAIDRLRSAKSPVYKMADSTANLKAVTTDILKPAKTGFKSLKAGKKSFTASLKPVSRAGKYEIRYSLKSGMKGAKTVKVTSKNLTKTVKKLKSGKTYYVQTRASRVVGGKAYGTWSASKKVKVK